jgi:hypothetical protein
MARVIRDDHNPAPWTAKGAVTSRRTYLDEPEPLQGPNGLFGIHGGKRRHALYASSSRSCALLRGDRGIGSPCSSATSRYNRIASAVLSSASS